MVDNKKKLIALSFLVPRDHSEEAVLFLRDITKTEPAIMSKLGMKLDRVTVYLPVKTNLESIKKQFQNFNHKLHGRVVII